MGFVPHGGVDLFVAESVCLGVDARWELNVWPNATAWQTYGGGLVAKTF